MQLEERDKTILSMVAAGYTNRKIAESLFVTEETIKNRLCWLYRVLRVGNRTEAVITAAKAKLINLNTINYYLKCLQGK